MEFDHIKSREIANLPNDAHVVVEGAHFTLQRDAVIGNWLGAGIYYTDIPASTAALPYETLRVPMEMSSGRCWAVLTLADGQELNLSEVAVEREVWSVSSADARYLETLRQGVDLFHSLRQNIAKATFCLLIGNLNLPKELRQNYNWALSADLRRELDRIDRPQLLLLAESTCQNRGRADVLRPADRLRRDRVEAERVYREHGYSILTSQTDLQGFWLAADVLLDPLCLGHPVISLTKLGKDGKARPSCAVTLACKLFYLAAAGATHHIVVYDADTDIKIRQKSVEGAMVASCFDWTLSTVSTIVVRGLGSGYSVDVIEPAAIQSPGRLSGPAALIEEAIRCVQRMGVARIDDRTSDVCCEIGNVGN